MRKFSLAVLFFVFVATVFSLPVRSQAPQPAPSAALPTTVAIDHADSTDLQLADAKLTNLQLQYQLVQEQLKKMQSDFADAQAAKTKLLKSVHDKYKLPDNASFNFDYTNATYTVTPAAAKEPPPPSTK